MDKKTSIKKNLQTSIDIKQAILNDADMIDKIERMTALVIDCYQKKGKVLFCGNGGSAADAQHLAAELSGRYYYDRPPLAAEAVHANAAYMTAVANDSSFEEVYARYVEAFGDKGDILISLSTSGNSKNVIEAIHRAKTKGMTVLGWTGQTGGNMKDLCDILLTVPSTDTPRIQECHMIIGHTICELVEKAIFPK